MEDRDVDSEEEEDDDDEMEPEIIVDNGSDDEYSTINEGKAIKIPLFKQTKAVIITIHVCDIIITLLLTIAYN